MEVRITTDQDTTNIAGTAVVTATVTPTAQALTPVRCQFSVNGIAQGSADTSYPLTFSWDTTAVPDGTYSIRADVVIKNRTRSASLTVTVKNTVSPPPPPPPPQNPPATQTAPTITGTETEGQTLALTGGSWTNNPTSYTRQWVRCDAAGANPVVIPSATGLTYVIVAEDTGATIRCVVTAHNVYGASPAMSTAETAAVGGVTPAPAPTEDSPVLMEIEE